MNKKELAKLIIKIINDKDVKDLKAYEWDSLAHLELMLYLEEAHSLVIDEESILDCSSAKGLCEKLNLPF